MAKRQGDPGKLTRRDFVGAALSPFVIPLTGCSGDEGSSDESAGAGGTPGGAGGGPGGGGLGNGPGGSDVLPSGAVLLGLYGSDGAAAMSEAAKRLDFSWLRAGDSVLIKVAANSANPHPSTTSPNGVRGMVAELKARGAGRVIVADQSGVEFVRLTQQGRFGATRDSFAGTGLAAAASGAETFFFDDQPFDSGYFPATLPAGNAWPRGAFLPSIVREVDHIVYMPRIGTHILAGNTLGQKMSIGWLRDDSRHDLHNEAGQFYEKYAEINYAMEIVERFRLAVTVSERILLHGGPDHGTPYDMTPVLVHASTSLPNHDALAASLLATLNARITTVAPGAQVYSAGVASQLNGFFANGFGVGTGAAGPWISGSTRGGYTAHAWERGVTQDRALARGWALTGGRPASIRIVSDGAALDPALASGITEHGEGLYAFA